MKKKHEVIGACIGWLAGPFGQVYAGKKTVLRALIELLAVIAIIWATHYTVAIPFVLVYAYLGHRSVREYNYSLKLKENK